MTSTAYAFPGVPQVQLPTHLKSLNRPISPIHLLFGPSEQSIGADPHGVHLRSPIVGGLRSTRLKVPHDCLLRAFCSSTTSKTTKMRGVGFEPTQRNVSRVILDVEDLNLPP
jgi:hypothetical protein